MKWKWTRKGRTLQLIDEESGEVLLGTAAHRSNTDCYTCGEEVWGDEPESWLATEHGDLKEDGLVASLIALIPEMVHALTSDAADALDFDQISEKISQIMEKEHGGSS